MLESLGEIAKKKEKLDLAKKRNLFFAEMFKPGKSLTVKESRALSGKDVKVLRKKIEEQFKLDGEARVFFSFQISRRRFFRRRPTSTSTSSLLLLPLSRPLSLSLSLPLSPNQPTNQLTPSESVLNALIPPKAEVTLQKLSNRSCAYSVAGQPLLFDLDGGKGNGPLLPTVYFLWATVKRSHDSSSPLLPEVFTFSEVSPK